MKRYYIFLLLTVFSLAFAGYHEWQNGSGANSEPALVDGKARKNYLHDCPGTASELINSIVAGQVRKKQLEYQTIDDALKDAASYGSVTDEQRRFHQNCGVSWGSKDGTVNIGASIDTGNVLLNLIPEPARSVIGGLFLLKDVASSSWFKKLFKIYPKMTSEECLEIINENPYTAELYRRLCKIASYIYQVDSGDVAIRTVARIQLLEAELPPPLDKKFKKAQKKLAKACANEAGDIAKDVESVNGKKIFESYMNQHLTDPQVFLKKIPKLKGYKNFQPKKGMSSAFNRKVINLVDNEPKISFVRLVDFCKRHSNEVIDGLYRYFVDKRSRTDTDSLNKDPGLVGVDIKEQSTEFQSQMLLRSHYQRELEEWISGSISDKDGRDITYRSLDNSGIESQSSGGYHFTILDNFIKNSCKGMGNSPKELEDIFFHGSGILKKYVGDSFVKEHFLQNRLVSEKLHQAVNYALAIREKANYHQLQEITQEIMNDAVRSLNCVDPDFAKMYEEEAYILYRQLADSKGTELLYEVMDPEKKFIFENLEIENDGQGGRYEAYQKAKAEKFHAYRQRHEIYPELKGYMQAHHMNAYLFSDMLGNSFQHHVTDELLRLVEKSMIKTDQFTCQFVNFLTEFVDLSQACNRTGKIVESLMTLEVAEEILKYLEAVALGCWDTAKNVYFMATHPILYISNMMFGVSKIIKHTGLYAYNLVFNELAARETEQILWNLIVKIKDKIWNATGPERVRMGVHFVTDQWATRRIFGLLGKLCGKVARAVKENPNMTAVEAINKIPKDKQAALAGCGEGLRSGLEGIKNTAPAGKPPVYKFSDAGGSVKTSGSAYAALPAKAIKKAGSVSRKATKAAKGAVASAPKPKQSWGEFLNSYFSNRKSKSPVLYPNNVTPGIHHLATSYISRLKRLFLGGKMKPEKILKPDNVKNLFLMNHKYSKILSLSEERLANINQLIATEGCKMRMAFGKMQKVTIRIRHIVQTRIKVMGRQLNKFTFDGLHSDPGGKIRKAGESGGDIKITKVVERSGCYDANVTGLNGESIFKTFFPESWSESKIVAKVSEALDGGVLGEFIKNNSGRRHASGFTSEGIKIKMVVLETKNGIEVISACPCGKWIGGG